MGNHCWSKMDTYIYHIFILSGASSQLFQSICDKVYHSLHPSRVFLVVEGVLSPFFHPSKDWLDPIPGHVYWDIQSISVYRMLAEALCIWSPTPRAVIHVATLSCLKWLKEFDYSQFSPSPECPGIIASVKLKQELQHRVSEVNRNVGKLSYDLSVCAKYVAPMHIYNLLLYE